jgi:hypothetical protein
VGDPAGGRVLVFRAPAAAGAPARVTTAARPATIDASGDLVLRAKSPRPGASFGAPQLARKSSIDATKLHSAFAIKGT